MSNKWDRYVIGPGLMVNLHDVMIIKLEKNYIVLLFSGRTRMKSKFSSDETAKTKFIDITNDMKGIFLLITKNELILKSRVYTIHHEPWVKGVFCTKTLGEKVIITFTNSFFQYNYYFDSEKDAVDWIDNITTELATNK